MTLPLLRRLAVASAVLASGIGSTAGAQIVTSANGTPYNTSGVESFSTGRNARGMNVYVCLSTGCNNYTWGNLTGSYSGVQTDDFRIRLGDNEDTFDGDWRFDLYSNANLESVTFSGFASDIVFDRTEPSFGTPGSSLGRDGDLINTCPFFYLGGDCASFNNTTVEYRNIVSLDGVTYGDLFESVFIDFSNVTLRGRSSQGGFDEDYSAFYMRLDTDNASLARVPEPGSLGLVAAGLLGLAGVVRRRRTR